MCQGEVWCVGCVPAKSPTFVFACVLTFAFEIAVKGAETWAVYGELLLGLDGY